MFLSLSFFICKMKAIFHSVAKEMTFDNMYENAWARIKGSADVHQLRPNLIRHKYTVHFCNTLPLIRYFWTYSIIWDLKYPTEQIELGH